MKRLPIEGLQAVIIGAGFDAAQLLGDFIRPLVEPVRGRHGVAVRDTLGVGHFAVTHGAAEMLPVFFGDFRRFGHVYGVPFGRKEPLVLADAPHHHG